MCTCGVRRNSAILRRVLVYLPISLQPCKGGHVDICVVAVHVCVWQEYLKVGMCGSASCGVILVCLQLGVDVIISDVDVLWLRNPIPYFQRYPTADVLSSSDHMSNTVMHSAAPRHGWRMQLCSRMHRPEGGGALRHRLRFLGR